jgi:hypothetical protein
MSESTPTATKPMTRSQLVKKIESLEKRIPSAGARLTEAAIDGFRICRLGQPDAWKTAHTEATEAFTGWESLMNELADAHVKLAALPALSAGEGKKTATSKKREPVMAGAEHSGDESS